MATATGDVKAFRDSFEEFLAESGDRGPNEWDIHALSWEAAPVQALALVDRVLTDPAGQEPLDALETRLRGAPVDWHEMVHDRKREVADNLLHSEVRRIVRDLRRDHPGLAPELRVNFRIRTGDDGRLAATADPVPPIPPSLQAWADAAEDVSVAGRLLE